MKKLITIAALAFATGGAAAAKLCKINFAASGYSIASIGADGNSGTFAISVSPAVNGIWEYEPGPNQCFCKVTDRGSGTRFSLGNKFNPFDNSVCGYMCGLVLYAGGSSSNAFENILK